MKTSLAALTLALSICFVLSGCGKKITDQKFADVAATIYENVQANWDHQSNETWATYYERRIAEACAKNGTSLAEWDQKMKDVKAHPEQFEKVVDKDVLHSLLEWEAQREAAKNG
ncbi:MAG TPA: hypothetical protein VGL38_13685 [bacterium]|jgi:uncharacterized protein YceK